MDATMAAMAGEMGEVGVSRRAALRRGGLFAAGLLIVGINGFFHSWRLAQTPGWDPQEGYNLDIAWNLAHGRLRLFALSSAFAQHPPLFYAQVVVAMLVFGYGVTAIRALAGLYALLCCVTLLLAGRRMVGMGAALWAALAYTAAPLILANTRWGYTYAQLAWVGLLTLWTLWEYRRARAAGSAVARRWLAAAAGLAGLATLSDYEGVGWIILVVGVALAMGLVGGAEGGRATWRDGVLAAGVALGVTAVGVLASALIAPGVFIADAGTTLTRAGGGNPLLQVIAALLNYYRFVTLDAWVLLGVVGLFFAPARTRGYLLGALLVVGGVVLKVRALGLSLHTAVPLLPLLALGMGCALDLALRRIYGGSLGWLTKAVGMARAARAARGEMTLEAAGEVGEVGEVGGAAGVATRLLAAALVFVVVVSPVGLALASDAAGLATTLPTHQDTLLATPADATATAQFVLTHSAGGGLTLASPELAWRFDAPPENARMRGADLLQVLAQEGREAAFYPAGLPATRWAYPVTLDAARYVVTDNLLRSLAAPDQLPALMAPLARVETWPLVFTRGQYRVYAHPGVAAP